MLEIQADGLSQQHAIESKPIDWNGLELKLNEPDRSVIQHIVAEFEQAKVPSYSLPRALMTIGGLDFCPFDRKKPITTYTSGGELKHGYNFLPDDDPARINFENAKSLISQRLINKGPAFLLRLAFINEHKYLIIPSDEKLRNEAREKKWDLFYWYNWAEINPENTLNKPDIKQKVGPQPLNHDYTLRLANEVIAAIKESKIATQIEEIASPFQAATLTYQQLPDYLAYLEHLAISYGRDRKNNPISQEVFNQFGDRFHQVMLKVVETIFEDEKVGNVFLSKKERRVLRQTALNRDIISMIIKKRGKKYRFRQKVFSGVISRLASQDSLLPLDLPLIKIEKDEVRNLIKTEGMSYQTYQKAVTHDRRIKLRKRLLTRVVPALIFLAVGSIRGVQTGGLDNLSVKSPEQIAQIKAIGLSNELGIRLCETLTPMPIDHPEKIEVIQPSDLPTYKIPPQEVGDYLAENNKKILIYGLIDSYYQGLIEFPDETAKEFLPHPALKEKTNNLAGDIIAQLKTLPLDPHLKVAFLNQGAGRKVDGALIANSQIAEELLIFLQGTKAIKVRFLPPYSQAKGYDDDPQLEAARKRHAYLYGQMAFSQAKDNKIQLTEEEKLTNIEGLLDETGIDESKIPLLTNRIERMAEFPQKLGVDPWDFISHLVKLNKEGNLNKKGNSQIDLETTLLFLDPQIFAQQMENVKPDFESAPLDLPTYLVAGSVVTLPERQGAILNTIQPEILKEIEMGLSRLMIRPLLAGEPGTLKIYARDGQTLIGEQARWGFREWLPFDQIPKEYIEAQTKTEDASFWEHCGVDPRGLARAIKELAQGNWQGGSTITMQVVEHFMDKEGNPYERKLKEFLTALAWEEALVIELGSKQAAKEFILEIYANIAPFGPTINGLKAAAEKYFNKQPQDLTLAEITFLVGLPQDPIGHDPFNHFDEARRTQKAVLKLLVENGAQFNDQALTQSQADEIYNEGIQLTPKKLVEISLESPFYFVSDWVLALLQENLPEEKLKEGGEIITPIDSQLQLYLKEMIDTYLAGEIAQEYQVGQAAAVVMDISTGEVLATFGNFRKDCSPGSTVKPFTYAAALEKGRYPNAQAKEIDEAVEYQGQTFTNSDGSASGKEVPLGVALRQSLNTVAFKIATFETGSISLARMYERYGLIPDKNVLSQISPAMTLGTIPVPPTELAAAFASLARGVRVQPSPISQIKSNASGQTVYSANPAASQQQNIDPHVAQQVMGMISNPDNLPKDPDDKVSGDWQCLEGPFAAKTGTSYNPFGGPKDVLIAGVTLPEKPEVPQYSVVIWLGPKENGELKEDATALPVVGPLYKQIMDYLLNQYSTA